MELVLSSVLKDMPKHMHCFYKKGLQEAQALALGPAGSAGESKNFCRAHHCFGIHNVSNANILKVLPFPLIAFTE